MPRLTFSRFLLAALGAAFFTHCAAQIVDPDREIGQAPDDIKKARAEEMKKFHTPVKGMDAATRMKGYQQRLKMEADSPFNNIKWRSVGPEVQSGRVVDIEAPTNQPGVLYLGFATGGLWRSEDYGNNWTPLFDRESAFGIGDFALSKDGNTIWIGTGENNSQRTSYSGNGVFKSTDRGATWQYMGLPESQHIGRVLLDPRNENTVYVGVAGHLYSQNPERGVYKTTDGGKTWQHVLKVDDNTGCIDIVMDPRNPDVLYAAMWDRDRRAWNFRESGPGSGVYKSTDAGKTWKQVMELPHAEAAGRIGLAISKSNPDRIYVYVDNHGQDPDWADADEKVPSGTITPRRFLLLDEAAFAALDPKALESFWRQNAPSDLKLEDVIQKVKDKKMTMKEVREAISKKGPIFEPAVVQTELIRSDDAGKTWHRTESGPLGGNSYYYFGNVIVNPKDPNDVFATGTELTRTRDGGKTWKQGAGRNVHVDFHAVWFDPSNVKHIIVGCDGGAYETFDDGVKWRHLNNMAVGQATTLALDNKTPYNIYVGLQDNGTMRGPSTYRPGLSDLNLWEDVGGGDGSAVAVDPRDGGDTIYVASQFGAHSGLNQKTKEQWSARASGQGIRYNWVSPIFISSFHPDIVYLGANKLFRSFNQGRKYEAISPDLTKNAPQGNVPFSTLKDISESPLKFGLIYVGTDDGLVKMTPDGGTTWVDVTTPAPGKWVSRVVASKWDIGTVYAAQNGYREDDFAPYLWKSTDFGKTWKSIVGNLPTECINVVREDPTRNDLLYVGTDLGVFVTYDGGANWESLNGGLPHVPVHDMQVQARDGDLVVATHARSAWVLPLKNVYSLTPEIRNKDITLFPVDDMRRDRNWGYPGGRFASIWNEPAVPTVRGSFFSKTGGKGFVRIKDKSGKVVKEKALDVSKGYNFFDLDLKIAEGGPRPAKPKLTKPEDVSKDPFEVARAKFLDAGEYTIEIAVGEKTVSQAWKLTAPSS